MILDEKVLKSGEQAIFDLRALYRKYGYSQYKMSKFEEYDLYGKNKDFLVGDGVITFTDTDGKLMALKPDVTLSIIKNSKDVPGAVQKVYYNENVYRISRNTHTFKEIMQAGLECIGDIDIFHTAETVLLAEKSLEAVGGRYVLDLSHMGLLSSMVGTLPCSDAEKQMVIRCIGEKNAHGIREIGSACGASIVDIERLIALISAYGSPSQVLPVLRELCRSDAEWAAVNELAAVVDVLDKLGTSEGIHIDFSVVNDMDYYSGIVFRGFVDGIAEGILSGGRYDGLMQKMGRQAGAIGFAVYLDLLEQLDRREHPYDADIVVLYEEDDDVAALLDAVCTLTAQGKSVRAEKILSPSLRFRQLMRFERGGLRILEDHD